MPQNPAGKTSGLQLAFAWAVVGIPILWAVWQVIIKARALFR